MVILILCLVLDILCVIVSWLLSSFVSSWFLLLAIPGTFLVVCHIIWTFNLLNERDIYEHQNRNNYEED